MSARKCPGCGEGLRGAKFGPVSLEFCMACTSIWFDDGVLPRIVNAGPQVVHKLVSMVRQFDPTRTTASSSVGPRFRTPVCPNCNVSLAAVISASAKGIIVDTCPICCGTCLTAGRLEEAAQSLFRGSYAPQPAVVEAKPSAPVTPPAPVASPVSPAPSMPSMRERPTPPAAKPPVMPRGEAPPPPWAPIPQAARPAAPSPGAGPMSSPAGVRPGSSPAAPPARRSSASATSQVECPGCSQPNSPDAPVCWACGKVLKGVICGTCPCCESHLHLLEWKDVAVRACDGCGGVWLADGVIHKLMQKPDDLKARVLIQVKRVRTGNKPQFNPAMLCKSCGTLMFRAPMMICPEPINTCPTCQGTFLELPTFETILRL